VNNEPVAVTAGTSRMVTTFITSSVPRGRASWMRTRIMER
jgi:hypothetical protein